MLGAVIASSSPAVGARCPHARARAGAVCTQNVTDPRLGPALLAALEAGRTAAEAVAETVATAPSPGYRQLTAVGRTGAGAAFTGEQALGRAASVTGPGCAAAGNLLAAEEVPAAMLDAFLADPAAELGDRLLAALAAGERAGGEEGPVHSAALVVVDEAPWPVTDLRVDWCGRDPVASLAELWRRWKPQAGDYVLRALDPGAAPGFDVPGVEKEASRH